MKITRFVNGSKRTEPLTAETVIKNQVVANTIKKVNQRLEKAFEADNTAGQNVYE